MPPCDKQENYCSFRARKLTIVIAAFQFFCQSNNYFMKLIQFWDCKQTSLHEIGVKFIQFQNRLATLHCQQNTTHWSRLKSLQNKYELFPILRELLMALNGRIIKLYSASLHFIHLWENKCEILSSSSATVFPFTKLMELISNAEPHAHFFTLTNRVLDRLTKKVSRMSAIEEKCWQKLSSNIFNFLNHLQ